MQIFKSVDLKKRVWFSPVSMKSLYIFNWFGMYIISLKNIFVNISTK